MAKKQTKKSSNLFWYILGALAVLVIILVVTGNQSSAIDYSMYNYTDAQVAKPNATHQLMEFGDFQCPYCGEVAPVIKAVQHDFDVNVTFIEFPLTQIHAFSQTAAEAAECARAQGRFWAYHDILYAHQANLAKQDLFAYAKGLGLDTQKFDACLNNRQMQVTVAKDVALGNKYNVTGTPTFYLDGKEVNYRTYAQFKQALQ